MQLGFLVFLLFLYSLRGLSWPIELALLALAVPLIWWPRLQGGLADLLPFPVILANYLCLRPYVSQLEATEVNVENLIRWEGALFGGILPPVWAQQALFDTPLAPFLDFLSNALYLLHFLLPLFFAVWVHRHQRPHYWSAMNGLFLLSLLGFATYVIFPAAPPWWATRSGFIPLPGADLSHFVSSDLITEVSPNPIAAMPSMHAAFPLYFALVWVSLGGRRLAWTLLLAPAVGAATVYLGHHYVIDALAGYAYAGAVALLWRLARFQGLSLDQD